jgi:Ala-tRNA(Pro) deacylase
MRERRAGRQSFNDKEKVMPIKTLKAYLDSHDIRYTMIHHSPAYTAQEIAASAHISGHNLAKTVIVNIDGKLAMVVLPASRHINFDLLSEMTGASNVRLASEGEFEGLFPGCELGAMPPFGNLFGMDVYVAPSLTVDHQIAFNAGTHTELLKMAYADFERLVRPRIVSLAC